MNRQAYKILIILLFKYIIINRNNMNSRKNVISIKDNISTSRQLQAQTNFDIELRDILPTDTFPCYYCFDQPQERVNCDVCGQLGFLSGDHPMVLFVNDYLNQNMESKYQRTEKNCDEEDINESGIGDCQQEAKLQSEPYINRQRQYQSEVHLSKKNVESIIPAKLLKSSVVQKQQGVHYSFCCNNCQCDPIKGRRFHCQQCQDFDLCQQCHNTGPQIQNHKKNHRMTIEGEVKKYEYTKKSIQNKKSQIKNLKPKKK